MLSKKVETAMNKQMNLEFYSGYIYLAMAAYFADLNLDGALETASLISARGFFIKRREKPIFWATVICG